MAIDYIRLVKNGNKQQTKQQLFPLIPSVVQNVPTVILVSHKSPGVKHGSSSTEQGTAKRHTDPRLQLWSQVSFAQPARRPRLQTAATRGEKETAGDGWVIWMTGADLTIPKMGR